MAEDGDGTVAEVIEAPEVEGGLRAVVKRKTRKKRVQSTTPTHLTDLKADGQNRRRRTTRSRQLIADSLREVGAARSIVIDEDGEVLAGNGVVEQAIAAGLDRVKVVDVDGQTVVAVRRTGLTPEQKRRLAMFDNRAGELSTWDPEQIGADVAQGAEMQPFFSETELRTLLKNAPHDMKVEEVQTGDVEDRFWIAIRGPLKSQAKALQKLRTLLADIDGVQVEMGTVSLDEAL